MKNRLYNKKNKFENKDSQRKNETVILTLQPIMVSV
jgi:hypothetical protein